METVIGILLGVSFLLLAAIVAMQLSRLLGQRRRLAAARRETALGEHDAAIEALRMACAADPSDLVSLFRLAELQVKAGQPADALVSVRALLAADLGAAAIPAVPVYLLAADAEFAAGSADRGYEHLLAVHGLDKTNTVANAGLARRFYEGAAFERAFYHANALERVDPSMVEGPLYAGLCLHQAKRWDEAVPRLARALELGAGGCSVPQALAECHAASGRVEEARGMYGLAAQRAEEPADKARLHLRWGTWAETQGAHAEAIERLEAAAGAGDQDTKVAALRALLTIHEAAFDLAGRLSVLERLVPLDPRDEGLGRKLAEVRDLAAHDGLEHYAGTAGGDFVELCKTLSGRLLPGWQVTGSDRVSDNVAEVVVVAGKKEGSLQKAVVRFLRAKGTVGDVPARELALRMQAVHAARGWLVANAGFSEETHKFAASRVIELVEYERLVTLFAKG